MFNRMDIVCQILLTFLLWLCLHTDIFVTIGLLTDQNCAACVNTVFEMVNCVDHLIYGMKYVH